jgi:hypothetical protein
VEGRARIVEQPCLAGELPQPDGPELGEPVAGGKHAVQGIGDLFAVRGDRLLLGSERKGSSTIARSTPPATTAEMLAAVPISDSLIRCRGCRSPNARRTVGHSAAATDGRVASRSSPVASPPSAATSSAASRKAPRIGSARFASSFPASVRRSELLRDG